MVSTLINPKGSSRTGQFARSDEYIFFVELGSSAPVPQPLGPEWQGSRATTTTRLRWLSMIRSGTGATRSDRPGMFYPILLDATNGSFIAVGDVLAPHAPRSSLSIRNGVVAVWPIRQDGTEGRWQVGPQTARSLRASGFLRVGRFKDEATAISYLPSGEMKKVQNGVFGDVVLSDQGHIKAGGEAATAAARVPTTQWALASHSASEHGSRLLRNLLPARKFPFPKSLYAVEDALRFFVADKPNALVLDFFAGSGTTAHAVMRLNHEDGGRRRSICVTNNEVGSDEQADLRAKGLKPGDAAWEAIGICDYITMPRIQSAITGLTSTAEAVNGSYRFVDEFPMEEGFAENAEFFTLTYEDPALVALGRRFEAISPLLWLRAGAVGERINHVAEEGWSIPPQAVYGVLFDTTAWPRFIAAVAARDGSVIPLTHLFVVTDSLVEFQQIVSRLDQSLKITRLYADYLRSFEINTPR
jgi:adenine-specific DNA-methyltransferase